MKSLNLLPNLLLRLLYPASSRLVSVLHVLPTVAVYLTIPSFISPYPA